jgi:hypothetical protein
MIRQCCWPLRTARNAQNLQKTSAITFLYTGVLTVRKKWKLLLLTTIQLVAGDSHGCVERVTVLVLVGVQEGARNGVSTMAKSLSH